MIQSITELRTAIFSSTSIYAAGPAFLASVSMAVQAPEQTWMARSSLGGTMARSHTSLRVDPLALHDSRMTRCTQPNAGQAEA